MKKHSILWGAMIIGLVMAACHHSHVSDGIVQEVDAFFTEAEQEITAIDNADELVEFVNAMPEKREKLVNLLADKYGVDENGNFKGLSRGDIEKLSQFLTERSTQYNEIEYNKCGEIITPFIDDFVDYIDFLYESKLDNHDPTEEQLEWLRGLYDELERYQDIVPEEQAERVYEADKKVVILMDDEAGA